MRGNDAPMNYNGNSQPVKNGTIPAWRHADTLIWNFKASALTPQVSVP
jgi:hypothetical protein